MEKYFTPHGLIKPPVIYTCRYFLHKCIPSLLMIYLPFVLVAQLDEVGTGKIHKKISCRDNKQYSYCCYLPKKYDPKYKYPVLYCFSPDANALFFVDFYKEACEELNWIIIGSNDSENGDIQKDALFAMWNDSHKRFSINDNRVYVSGFSGGSRVATWFGSEKKIKGHIAIGGVYAPVLGLTKISHWWLMCGDKCFNRSEMEQAEKKLKKRGDLVTLKTFKGQHNTPPPKEFAKEAIKWMDDLCKEEIEKILKAVKSCLEEDPVKAYLLINSVYPSISDKKTIKGIDNLLEGLVKNDKVQIEIKARKALDDAKKSIDSLKLPKQKKEAIELLDKVIKEYPKANASREAEELITDLKSQK